MNDFNEVLELNPPHGFLMAQGKQTAIARIEPLETDKFYLIVSNGEAFGIAKLEQPAQVKIKEFDSLDWASQHRITQRERRQWWSDNDSFYVHRLKDWQPFEGVKLYEDGQVIDEPRLTSKQWDIVSKAKELPKQIILDDNFIQLTCEHNALCGDKSFYNRELKPIIDATFNRSIECTDLSDDTDIIPVYSLALVRNPRMRVSKKNLSPEGQKIAIIGAETKQEDETMPYRIRRNDDEFCVVKINPDDTDGDVEGCHDTEEEAQAQLTALNINVVAEEKEFFGNEQSADEVLNFIRRQFETQFNPDDNTEIASKNSYVWVNDIFESFIIVDEDGILFRVDYIMLDDQIVFSSRDKWVEVERGYSPKGFKKLVSDLKHSDGKPKMRPNFMNRLKLAAKNILDIVTLAEKDEEEDISDILTSNYGIAQKEINGEIWHLTWSTNAFEDREKEIFSTESLKQYVNQATEKNDKGFFNFWHIQGTDFAKKEWQMVIGRFLVEAGPYLDNEAGNSAKEFFAKYNGSHPDIAPEGWGCSPEFRYLPEERATGTYENVWITRTSTLPRMAAANIWTETNQLTRSKMAITDYSEDQIKAAIEVFKDENFVKSLIQQGETKTTELEAAGVAHKEKKEEQTEPEQTQVNIDMEALASEVGKQFQANLDPVADAITTMASSIEELQKRLEKVESESKVKAVTESPRFVFNLKRASEDQETVVTEDDILSKKKPVETKGANGDPWSQIFNK